MNLEAFEKDIDYLEIIDKNEKIVFNDIDNLIIFTTCVYIPMNNKVTYKSLSYLQGFITLVENFKSKTDKFKNNKNYRLVVFCDQRLFMNEFNNNIYSNKNNNNNINKYIKKNYSDYKDIIIKLQTLWQDYINLIIKNETAEYDFIKIYSYDIKEKIIINNNNNTKNRNSNNASNTSKKTKKKTKKIKRKYDYPGLPDTFGSIIRVLPFFYPLDNTILTFSINASHHITDTLLIKINKYLDNAESNNSNSDANNKNNEYNYLFDNLLCLFVNNYMFRTSDLADKLYNYFMINGYNVGKLPNVTKNNIHKNLGLLKYFRIPLGLFGVKKGHKLFNIFKLLKKIILYYYDIKGDIEIKKSIFEYGFDEIMIFLSLIFYNKNNIDDLINYLISMSFKNNEEIENLSNIFYNYSEHFKLYSKLEGCYYNDHYDDFNHYHKYLSIKKYSNNNNEFKKYISKHIEEFKQFLNDNNYVSFYYLLDEFFDKLNILVWLPPSKDSVSNPSDFDKLDNKYNLFYNKYYGKSIFSYISDIDYLKKEDYTFININNIKKIDELLPYYKPEKNKIYSICEILYEYF